MVTHVACMVIYTGSSGPDSHVVLPNYRVGKRSFKHEHTWIMEIGSNWGLLLAIINNLDACHSDVLSVRVLTFF
jgi:hypothetical protein